MFERRKREKEALNRAVARHMAATCDIKNDDEVAPAFKAKALNMLNEEADALISAVIAYDMEPVLTAVAVICATISVVMIFIA